MAEAHYVCKQLYLPKLLGYLKVEQPGTLES